MTRRRGNNKRGGQASKDEAEVSSTTTKQNKKQRASSVEKTSKANSREEHASTPLPLEDLIEKRSSANKTSLQQTDAAPMPVADGEKIDCDTEEKDAPSVIPDIDRPIQRTNTNTDEALVSYESYDLPFTIFQRFIPTASDSWNMDSNTSTAYNIFSASGARRKKEVKDDFEWLQPTSRAADLSAAKEAHASKYNFINGISTKDPKLSTSKYSVPFSVHDRITNFEPYYVPMKHKLSFIEQSVTWLMKPVSNLLDRIRSSGRRTHTRSCLHDAQVGKDLFRYAAYCNANNFVCSSDDVELIDFVKDDLAKKIWHCAHVMKNEMLRKAIISAYTSAIQGDDHYGTPEWLSLLNSARSKDSSTSQLQFLGLVSLYESKSGNKVNALRMHSFVLYSWSPRSKTTNVHLFLTEQRVTTTSSQERILQILQMIQADHNESTALTLVPEFIVSLDTKNALLSLGFTMETYPKNPNLQVFTRQSVVKISKFTNRVMWGCYGLYLSHADVVTEGMDAIVQLQCRLVAELLLRPLQPSAAIGIRFKKKDIYRQITNLFTQVTGVKNDIDMCAQTVRRLATKMTRIPLAVLTHTTVLRLVTHGGQGGKTLYETTLELLQYVSIALKEVQPICDSFAGDCNTCVLYCEKCHHQFGREGNIFQVLSEASLSILYHHGLELTELDSDDNADDLDEILPEKRFKKSLPMHAMTIGMGAKYLSLTATLNEMQSQRCKYGIGTSLSRDHHAINHHYMHNLNDAMRIDAFFAGNEEILNKRSCFTMALLFSIFDVVSDPTLTGKKNAGAKKSDHITSFENYASMIDDAFQSGEKWIQAANVDSSSINHLKIIVGWCCVLSQQFLLNCTYLSTCVFNVFSGSSELTFTSEELLSRIGLTSRLPELMTRCKKYSMLDESVKNFECKIIDKVCSIPLDRCLNARPMQDRIEESADGLGLLSKIGSGWNASLCKSWFAGKNESLEQQAKKDRKISSYEEAQESIIIMKTASSVTLEYEDEEKGRSYLLTCNVDDIVRHNPGVLTGEHESLYSKPTFACSNSIITSLPFQFVKNLRVGKPQNIPKTWKALAIKDAMHAESSIMTSIQLWRHMSCQGENSKISIERIYRATYEIVSKGKISMKTAFIREKDAIQHLRSEQWLVDGVSKLCSVRNYDTITFGEGAKSSKEATVPSCPQSRNNFWYCPDNHGKLCTEGAVANMLYHMNMEIEADEFKTISILTQTEILLALQQTLVPKRVLAKGRGMDPLEKCMWILERKYNCQRFGYLNTDHFQTPKMVVENMNHVDLPVILCVVGRKSVYSHVVVLWRGKIIDFETPAPYPLTVKSIENICGSKNPFHYVRCGYVVAPSKKMKVSVGDFTDWGGKLLREKYYHLFRKNP